MTSLFFLLLSLLAADFLGLLSPFLGALRARGTSSASSSSMSLSLSLSKSWFIRASAGLHAALPLFCATRCRALRVLAVPHHPPALALPSANACSSIFRRPRAESPVGCP